MIPYIVLVYYNTFDSPSRLAITARILDTSTSSYKDDGWLGETEISVGLGVSINLSTIGAGAIKEYIKLL